MSSAEQGNPIPPANTPHDHMTTTQSWLQTTADALAGAAAVRNRSCQAPEPDGSVKQLGKCIKIKPPGFTKGLSMIVLAASLTGVHAQTTTLWIGAIDSNWHNAGNWSNGLPGGTNLPAIEKAGSVVNLTQDVTVTGTGRFFNVRSIDPTNGTLPATLNISANLNLGSNAFEIGSRYSSGNPATAYYQGIVNQTAGEVTAGAFRLALRGGIASAPPSEYNLSGGKLTLTGGLIVTEGANNATAKSVFHHTGGDVTVGGDFRQGVYQGSGTYLMEAGTLGVAGRFLVSDRSVQGPLFHQTGGS